jgi:hypothetical protein
MDKLTHWTEEQKQFVRDNAGRLPVEDIAAGIGRSPRAVILFLHRNRVAVGKTVAHNLTLAVLKRKFGHPEYFAPNRRFFRETRINQKRWWDLYCGRKQITPEEYDRLCSHLDIPPEDKFEARQMDIIFK